MTNCKNCGAATGFDQYGPHLMILDTNSRDITALFAGKLDEARCEVCSKGFGFRQNLYVVLTDPPEVLLAPGDWLKEHAETGLPQLRKTLAEQVGDIPLIDLASAEALRAELWQRMSRYYDLFEKLEQSKKDGRIAEWLSGHWREMKPAAFVAGFLILGAKAQQRNEPPDSPLLEKQARAMSEWQANVWMMMCREWAETPPEDGSFEDDLQGYLIAAAIHPMAVEEFGKRADLFANENPKALKHLYCLEAVRATLHRFFDRPNPRAGEWAHLLAGYERLLARLTNDEKPMVIRLRVGQERVQQTVNYQSAYDAMLPLYAEGKPGDFDYLQALASRFGFPNLLPDLFNATRVSMPDKSQLPSHGQLIDDALMALSVSSSKDGVTAMIAVLKALRQFFSEHFAIDDYEKLADEALKRLPQTDLSRAEVNAWLGQVFKEMGEPARVLERIGEEIPQWEEKLPRETQITLWTERGNALRAARNPWAARVVYHRVAELFDGQVDSQDGRTARRNLAISYRETGAPDVALRMLEEALPLTAGEERLLLLENLAATYIRLGQWASARQSFEEAVALASGPFAKHRRRLESGIEMMTAAGETGEKAIERLLKIDFPPIEDEIALLAVAAAWLNALHHVEDVAQFDRDDVSNRVQDLIDLLLDASDRAEQKGSTQYLLLFATALAQLADLYNLDSATQLWDSVNRLSMDAGGGLDPMALLAMARLSYRDGAVEPGRSLLELVPNALSPRVGQAESLDLAVEALSDLGWMFKRATRAVIEQPLSTLADVRLAAELRRDAIRRSMESTRRDNSDASFVSPSDERLASLAPSDGTVGVIEWIDIGSHTAMLLSGINSDGIVFSHWLQLPDVDLNGLHERILTRLRNWTTERPGDPFDLPNWVKFEEWVAAEVAQYLPGNSHLVVIEHEDLHGFPWHVAASPRWTCSYASSWNSLLRMTTGSEQRDENAATLGVAAAPQFGEGEEMLKALRESARRSSEFATANGLPFRAAYDTECDHDRLHELMQSCDVLKILCHGFVSEEEREVAWMIAAGGELPLKSSEAADTPAGRAHRFSWRQIAQLQRAPRAVFSAACSSARAHIAGEGERLGLFPPLEWRGARAMVAPGWDIEPINALGILDDALEIYLSNGGGLAAALRKASLDAAGNRHLPRWLAWAFTIEGDWR